jgi:hypothetical protein
MWSWEPTLEGWLVISRDAMEALDNRTLLKLSHKTFDFQDSIFKTFHS